MSIKLNLRDGEFPFTHVSHTRIVVRGIVLNDENKVAVCVVNRDDIFGKCNYIETPGGGKEENESLEEGLIRELDEELGYKVEVIDKVGIIEDYYNLINRKNINHYYLCRIKDKTKVLMIGDRFHDIEGAKKNGIKSLGQHKVQIFNIILREVLH